MKIEVKNQKEIYDIKEEETSSDGHEEFKAKNDSPERSETPPMMLTSKIYNSLPKQNFKFDEEKDKPYESYDLHSFM